MKRSAYSRYGFALVVCMAAFFITKGIQPFFDTHLFEFFQAAAVLSAWYGGRGPGIFAASVSFLIIDYHFLHPINHLVMNSTDFMRLVIFEAVAVLTSSLSGKLRTANARLKEAHVELEQKVTERTEELSRANSDLKSEINQRLEAEKAMLDVSNREQRRLGQDLHDGLSQIIAGVKFMSQGLKETMLARSAPETKMVSMIESQLGVALEYVDTVSRGLYPVELEVSGLMAALTELTEKTSAVYPVTCEFRCWTNIPIEDGAVANHLYRIAQEAVINAVKSGGAQRIRVRLSREHERTTLTVVDNGIGFGNKPLRKGMGIKMMEYRARLIGAIFKIKSRAKGGTVLTCRIPKGTNNGN